jgi:hypothetical protein
VYEYVYIYMYIFFLAHASDLRRGNQKELKLNKQS